MVPVTDTLKALRKVENADGNIRLERMEGVVADRSLLYAAQTPQVFHSEILKDSYRQAFDTAFTDDASVAERKIYRLHTLMESGTISKSLRRRILCLRRLYFQFDRRDGISLSESHGRAGVLVSFTHT